MERIKTFEQFISENKNINEGHQSKSFTNMMKHLKEAAAAAQENADDAEEHPEWYGGNEIQTIYEALWDIWVANGFDKEDFQSWFKHEK